MSLSFRLEELAAMTRGRVVSGNPKAVVTRLAIDSRQTRPGDYFVALKGQNHDGHEFVAGAVSGGAGGVVVSEPVRDLPPTVNCLRVPDTLRALQEIGASHRRSSSVRVIGVTGSNGKTTTKEMAARILAAAGESVLSTRGNLNSQIGLPLMLMELAPEHTHAVLEMGASRTGEIARLAELAGPRTGIITNIGRAHLESFGGVENVYAAKWELAAALPRDGVAVLNADDPYLPARIGDLACSAITFGLSPRADVRAENIRQEPEAVFDLIMGGTRREVRLPVPGLFNVYNALAAVAAAFMERISLNVITRGLETFVPLPFRMQIRRRADGGLFVLDAYNANPSSMKASLESFEKAFPDRRRVAVLGSMRELGTRSEPEHVSLGESLAGFSLGEIFFIGEEGPWVREGLRRKSGQVHLALFSSNDVLRRALEEVLSPDTAVLFKASRGVRLEEVFEPLLGPREESA